MWCMTTTYFSAERSWNHMTQHEETTLWKQLERDNRRKYWGVQLSVYLFQVIGEVYEIDGRSRISNHQQNLSSINQVTHTSHLISAPTYPHPSTLPPTTLTTSLIHTSHPTSTHTSHPPTLTSGLQNLTCLFLMSKRRRYFRTWW